MASLFRGFDVAEAKYLDGWIKWHRSRTALPAADADAKRLIDFSAAVLRVHESKDFGGGVIASLSIPWGFEKGDADLGGYGVGIGPAARVGARGAPEAAPMAACSISRRRRSRGL